MRAEEIWAKSPIGGRSRGESLSEHTQRVLTTFEQWRERLPFLPELCGSPSFWDRAGLGLLLHDLGKCASGFQDMVHGEAARFGHRHEVLSCLILPRLLDKQSPDFEWVSAAILSHHKDFPRLFELYPPADPWLGREEDSMAALVADVQTDIVDVVEEYYSRYLRPQIGGRFWVPEIREGSENADPVSRMRDCLDGYIRLYQRLRGLDFRDPDNLQALFLRGIVKLCDHAGSAHVTVQTQSIRSLGDLLPRLPFGRTAQFPHQSQAAATRGNAVLRAPTGSGKTEAALLWAFANPPEGSPPIFYVLPYQASLNAMYDRFSKVFGDRGVVLQHSHALGVLYRRQMEKGYTGSEAEKAAKREHGLARLHTSTVRLLTPYQLLKAPFQLPGHEAVGTDMSGGRFVLDEIHAYEPYRLGLLAALFKSLSRHFRAQFLFMSATMPRVLESMLHETLGHLGSIRAAPATVTEFRRHRLHLLDHDLISDKVVEMAASAYSEGLSVLLTATTVARVQALAGRLASIPDLIVVHGKFCARDRLVKERQLEVFVGRNLVPRDRRAIVAVATQVVEVSLDLDFDLIVSDPAPLEALIQRFGRVNRGMRRPECPVYVCRSVPQGSPVYAADVITETLDVLAPLDSEILDDGVLQQCLDRIYEGKGSAKWLESLRDGINTFERNVLASWRAFDSQDQLQEMFDAMFDGDEILPECLLEEYLVLLDERPLEAPSLLVPVSSRQLQMLKRKGLLSTVPQVSRYVRVATIPYTSTGGLQLSPGSLNGTP